MPEDALEPGLGIGHAVLRVHTVAVAGKADEVSIAGIGDQIDVPRVAFHQLVVELAAGKALGQASSAPLHIELYTPFAFSVGQSSGPTRSIAAKPMSFTVVQSWATDSCGKVQRATECFRLPLSGAVAANAGNAPAVVAAPGQCCRQLRCAAHRAA